MLNTQFLTRGLRDIGDSELLRRLTTARQALTPPRGRHALPRIAQGVMAFRMQGSKTPYPDLKYACYGLARPTDWDSRVLLEEPQKCDELLTALAAASDKLSSGAKENGRKLGAFLAQAKR